jgi:hypothetical protein
MITFPCNRKTQTPNYETRLPPIWGAFHTYFATFQIDACSARRPYPSAALGLNAEIESSGRAANSATTPHLGCDNLT